MKTKLCLLALFFLALSLNAAPRKVGGLSFPRDESRAPRIDASLQQDALVQEDRESAEAIRQESDSSPSLTERPSGETFTEYQQRLESARERLENTPVTDESLRDSQMEAIYEAEYQLRKEAFYDKSAANTFGQGAGPWGIQKEQPLELQRVIRLLESKREQNTTTENVSAVGEAATEAPVPEQEREEDTPEP